MFDTLNEIDICVLDVLSLNRQNNDPFASVIFVSPLSKRRYHNQLEHVIADNNNSLTVLHHSFLSPRQRWMVDRSYSHDALSLHEVWLPFPLPLTPPPQFFSMPRKSQLSVIWRLMGALPLEVASLQVLTRVDSHRSQTKHQGHSTIVRSTLPGRKVVSELQHGWQKIPARC